MASVRFEHGWGKRIRTPVPWSRATCPTTGRSPNRSASIYHGLPRPVKPGERRAIPELLQGTEVEREAGGDAPTARVVIGLSIDVERFDRDREEIAAPDVEPGGRAESDPRLPSVQCRVVPEIHLEVLAHDQEV